MAATAAAAAVGLAVQPAAAAAAASLVSSPPAGRGRRDLGFNKVAAGAAPNPTCYYDGLVYAAGRNDALLTARGGVQSAAACQDACRGEPGCIFWNFYGGDAPGECVVLGRAAPRGSGGHRLIKSLGVATLRCLRSRRLQLGRQRARGAEWMGAAERGARACSTETALCRRT